MPHKLLLADDSVTIQRVIELTFADEDVQVIAVGDGQQAIERIEREHPDIVLADVGMPERDGYEVASFVKSNPGLAHIPVLLLTGAFEPVDEARARAIGCDGVLVKPFEPQMVINRVRDLLAGKRPPTLWATPPGPPTAPARPAAKPQGVAAAPAAAPELPDLSLGQEQASRPAAPGPESLDDYFDRLDAAFGTVSAPAPAASLDTLSDSRLAAPTATDRYEPPASSAPRTSFADEIAEWDAELRRGAAPPPPPAPAPPSAAAPPPAPQPSAPPPAVRPMEAGTTVRPIEPPADAWEPPVAPAASSATLAGSPPAPPPLADAFAALLAAEQGLPTPSPVGFAPAPATAAVTPEVVEEVTRRVLERLSDRVVRDTVTEIVSQVAERLVREEIDRIKKGAS